MSPSSDVIGSPSPATFTEPLRRKRRRIARACLSCRRRKSRCNGDLPKCSTCSELDLSCEYTASEQAPKPTVAIDKEQFQALENRLNSLELLLSQRPISEQTAFDQTTPAVTGPLFGLDGSEHGNGSILDAAAASASGELMSSAVGSEDPTNGMGHFVFADEEDRAFFGPSSSIAFTSELSRAFGRVTRSSGNLGSNYGPANLPELRIARVSRRSSPAPRAPTLIKDSASHSALSIYYLPSHAETSALIDRYFLDTGLLFPYIHEETFRETYAQLQQNRQGIRRTWLGLLNMVLAMATHTSIVPAGKVTERQMRSEAFYQRASRLCEQQVMNGASLEIGQRPAPFYYMFYHCSKTFQYLLLVSQYMQGTSSSIQTWAMHGLAVKVAMQLGLHSTEAARRLPPVEREIRKRTWFGCIVLDRYVIPLPCWVTSEDNTQRSQKPEHDVRPRLYSIIGNAIDLLYGGNLGCGDHILTYELITRILKLRHLQDEWARRLPPHMTLVKAESFWEHVKPDPVLDRFRVILTLRYHNLRVLTHRVVLARLCDLVGHASDEQNHDVMGLKDVIGSTVEISIESTTEIIGIIYAIVQSADSRRDLLGAWWFTLYYAFDAALVLSTVILLLRQAGCISLPESANEQSLKKTLSDCMEALKLLDEGNHTVERCYMCLHRLVQVLSWMGTFSEYKVALSFANMLGDRNKP
ncbi:hypothetical protein GQ53DRAFT_646245 [Thozetella sp. PMI_491]|nr:hypothetical protein GQ53DRAFT_646245 [Thozetella sp. PMI_491]